ncbi:UNVERIFIED_CONTAM: hypothetical protein Sradi_0708800 [Sesamum radiatum]|uniref:Uncharacterized protein n=1 Tax=Sesamum radiatum TaxID=300843 RepID=A0AAW2VNF3_SESRA
MGTEGDGALDEKEHIHGLEISVEDANESENEMQVLCDSVGGTRQTEGDVGLDKLMFDYSSNDVPLDAVSETEGD